MKLTRKIGLALVAAFLIPTVGMGAAAWRELRKVEGAATRAAVTEAFTAERGRLGQLTERRAQDVDARLAQVQLEVEHLRELFQGGYSPALAVVARDDLYPGQGLPGYGTIDPALGVYADFDRRGSASPWMPRATVRRLETDPKARAEIVTMLRRTVALTPAFTAIGARQAPLLDLAWVVTRPGVTNSYPPYNFREVLRENPGIADLDETTEDYVALVAPDADPGRSTRWLDPYRDEFKGEWMTSVVAPLYDGDEFVGSTGVDLLLRTLTDNVLALPEGTGGYAVLVGPTGRLIATTREGIADLAWTESFRDALLATLEDGSSPEATRAIEETSLDSSPDANVRTLALASRTGPPGVTEVDLGGTHRLAAYAPVKTASWGLIVIVPTSTIVANAQGVHAAIASGNRTIVNGYILFTLVVLALCLGMGAVVQGLVIRPITGLARRMGSLSFDDLELAAEGPPRDDEVGQLHARVAQLLEMIRASRDRLKEERALLSATLGSIGDAVVVTNERGRVELMNPVAEQLARGETKVGRPLLGILPLTQEADGAPAEDPVARVLAAGRSLVLPERLLLRAGVGEARAVEVSGAPMRAADGHVSGVVLVLRDVTDSRRIEDELARVQKLETVQVLAAGIAHDFNNLLAGVLGYVSLARMMLDEDHPAQAKLERAEAAVERGQGLTLQLLTFSRGGAPVRQVIVLPELLHQAAELALRGASSRVEWALATDLWPVLADPGQIAQVVQNLVLNADQAMVGGGRVHIAARNELGSPGPLRPGRYVEVAVTDTGRGIAREDLPRIFDPFFTTKAKGTGLGLAVCFSILRKHGGHIEVTSTTGIGSTFRFWLPATDETPRPVLAATDAPELLGLRVLLMDDDATLRDVVGQMLTSLGCVVQVAADGDQAVAIDARSPSDVAVLDLTVPGGMGGREAVQALRANAPELLAIVCSGYSEDPVLADPAAFGFDGALQKPFDLATLRAELARVGGAKTPSRRAPPRPP